MRIMSDQSSLAKRKPGNPAWVAGAPSPNPGGRPKGESLQAAARRRGPPHRILDAAEKILDAKTDPASVRMAALAFVAERAHGKVTSVVDANITTAAEPQFNVSNLSADEQRDWLAKIQACRVAGGDGDEP
ncbi:MAG: hypothetical protein WKG01_07695 [Kofleriaceae bacterium]